MSAAGLQQTSAMPDGMSALPPESGHQRRAPPCLLWATSRLMHCSNEGLFDHLVSTGEHIGRDSQANGFGGFQIDDKFKLGWLFYR